MQTRERHINKPERDAITRATAAETVATRYREEAARLTRDLAEMREDRDRWRAQAEKLAGAVERLKGPGVVPAAAAIDAPGGGEADLIYGARDIAAFLNMRVGPARSLIEKKALPTFKIGKTVCARRSTLNAWLAEREAAAAQEGR